MDFGIDNQLWKTKGNQFVIKDITPGIHLFYWRHSENPIITSGKFYKFNDGDNVSWMWDIQEDGFKESNSFDYHDILITKYQQSNEWYEYTSEIIWCERYFNDFISSMDVIIPLIPPTKQTLLRGAELTASVLDKSCILKAFSTETLLSEMQCSFLTFKYLHNWSAWECWRDCLQTICCSASYCNENTSFTCNYLNTVMHQLPDINQDDLISDTFLIQKWFAMLINDCIGNERLKSVINEFNYFLTKRLNWKIEERDEEDEMPQFVTIEHE